MGFFKRLFGSYSDKELRRVEPIAKQVEELEPTYQAMSDKELQKQTVIFRERLANGETLDDILPEAFATVRESSVRILGQRPFYVQVVGAIILHQGRIAEMKTGEGKTLTATLSAYLNALTGKGVHIVTVNDYLAKYQSEWMGKLFNFLGLSVGLVVHGIENPQRRDAYASDITYGTNNELGFDYLRDNMVTYQENKVQRTHNFAIVDEVDSILIDEARTPLIISGRGDEPTDLYTIANNFASRLTPFVIEETDTKVDQDSISDGDYIVDEKSRSATLTQAGVKKAERAFSLDNLMDGENMTILHHINQAIKAHGSMHRDVDYVVKDDQVIIVDENTGRLMLGRRYNEGLHQAIEAKEGVKVEKESKTLATITFQNYFRMYNKLSGMTGTALTEEDEFREIYRLDVIVVPTNMPIVRQDQPDVVYKTIAAKYEAVIEEIIRAHETGQPVLVGTVSIDKSEHLSRLLKARRIDHVVLNAKQHEREAEIVAQAGQFGSVTIATNMAGRGTDILLGGNADFLAKAQLEKTGLAEEILIEVDAHGETDDPEILAARAEYNRLNEQFKKEISIEAEKVKAAGGLYIIGTERHESRRIDNQLRGRAGRQGDPGESKFYLSLEDDLMRLFGGERLQNVMNTMRIEDDMPIESSILTNAIEGAQRKVEARNFGIRKSVLEFDDVMNRQREIIYGQRSQVLDGEDMSAHVQGMMNALIEETVVSYLPDESMPIERHHLSSLHDFFVGWILREDELLYANVEPTSLNKDSIIDDIKEIAHNRYDEREKSFGTEMLREIERVVLLQNVDSKWMDHIDAMDDLKQGIYLRSYGQRDPVVEYRIEGFDMFDEMIHSIQEDTIKMLFTFQIRSEDDAPQRRQVAQPTAAVHGESTTATRTTTTTAKASDKVGRNEPCPCGSGKKYKQCHGR